ncbi:hypothetical protein IMSHALPRED_009766 [Imshaugia aleurites]|uniref:Subtilisin-like serine protease protein n=1 Tax=Imshaugia aleurites TaxID=172621 RepID=A0A8H3G0X4_9LECA|nr:hypothetical protein IMSHALPRED_009766 [Imshaugia aleurites]
MTSSAGKLIMPVVHQGQDHVLRLVDPTREEDLRSYVRDDLDVDGLNKVHKHLWFAGLPRCARPLHQQLMIDRKIFITERADLHLLWGDGRLFLKPLPDYLLSYDIWEGTLRKDWDLFENAKGFLLSYLWLIRRKSDFIIAQRENLVNDDLVWEQWTAFSAAIFPKIDPNGLEGISPRYLYGELRLTRVNLIYRLCHKTRNPRTFVYGYHVGYERYSDLITQNFAWVVTAILYVGIVLTAMQVGLATTELQNSALFNRASYGFTIFSILAPLGILLVAVFLLLLIIVFNLIYTVKQRYAVWNNYPAVFGNVALQPHKH